jgi:hypothetical protein
MGAAEPNMQEARISANCEPRHDCCVNDLPIRAWRTKKADAGNMTVFNSDMASDTASRTHQPERTHLRPREFPVAQHLLHGYGAQAVCAGYGGH